MKNKNTIYTCIFWSFLLAGGIVIIARTLHPAVFSIQIFPLLILVSFIAGILMITNKKS